MRLVPLRRQAVAQPAKSIRPSVEGKGKVIAQPATAGAGSGVTLLKSIPKSVLPGEHESTPKSPRSRSIEMLAGASLSTWSSREYLKLLKAPVLQHSLAVNYALNKTKTLLSRCTHFSKDFDSGRWAQKVTSTLESLNVAYQEVEKLEQKPDQVTSTAQGYIQQTVLPAELEKGVYKLLEIIGQHLDAIDAAIALDERVCVVRAKLDSTSAQSRFTAETLDSTAAKVVRACKAELKKIRLERKKHDVGISDYIRERTSEDRCNLTDCLDIIQNTKDSSFTRLMTERQSLSEKEKDTVKELENAENVLKFVEESKTLLHTAAMCIADAGTGSKTKSYKHKRKIVESSSAILEGLIPTFGERLLKFVQLLEERRKYAQAKLSEKLQDKKRLQALYESGEASLELQELQGRIDEYLTLIKSTGVKLDELSSALESCLGGLLSGTSRLCSTSRILAKNEHREAIDLKSKVESPLRKELTTGTFFTV